MTRITNASRWSSITQVAAGPDEPIWFGARSPETLDPRFRRFFEFIEQSGGMFPDAGVKRTWPASHRLLVTGPLQYRGKDLMQAELALVREALAAAGVDHTETFYPQLSPGWLGHFLFNAHYPSAEEYWYALAEAWRGEYEAVAEAGFILQLDDPALADKYYMCNPPLSVEEYRKDAALRVEATNHALRNIPEDRIRYHVCWGSWHFPHTTDIPLEHIVDLLLKVKAQAYLIEASNVRHEADYRLWQDVQLPAGKILIPGVVGHATSNLVEPVARIFQEEIFGPVAAITPFDTQEKALALANGVKYGLAAYIWTSNLERAHLFARSGGLVQGRDVVRLAKATARPCLRHIQPEPR